VELLCLLGAALSLAATLLEPLRDGLVFFCLWLLYLSLYQVISSSTGQVQIFNVLDVLRRIAEPLDRIISGSHYRHSQGEGMPPMLGFGLQLPKPWRRSVN